MKNNKKVVFKNLKEKNNVIKNIINAMDKKNNFLIIGHKNPDEDCIASMISFALLLSKFSKSSKIFLESEVHKNFSYLLSICKYNFIEIVNSTNINIDNVTTLVICDTPKTSMIEMCNEIEKIINNKNILKIEFDHHIGTDSEYIGDKDYCFVTEASSTCELIGQLVLKIDKKNDLKEKYNINDLMTRNLILSILTGIIGDTKMGQFIKSKNERKYYNYFSKIFSTLLKEKTINEANFSTKEELFNEIIRLSSDEDKCYKTIINMSKMSKYIGYIVLNQNKIDKLYKQYDNDVIISVVRTIADELAEKSKKLGIVAYYDNPQISDMVQFRVRRSKEYKVFDLRNILSFFSIENGGGHEGAIGFRIPKNKIQNIDKYISDLIHGIEKSIDNIK